MAKDIDEKIISWCLQQTFYHGLLPRNDLIYVLKKKGDYLLRNTERPTQNGRQRDIVLSLAWPVNEATKTLNFSDIKNILIKRNAEHVYLETNIKFQEMCYLFDHYRNNPITFNNTEMRLMQPVGLVFWEFKHSQITLIRKVGEGAYGEVYRGKLKRVKTPKACDVAIKTLRSDIDANDEKMKEVMAEARLMRMLNHPNIVRIRGIAVLEQPLYIVIDFIDGGGLDSYLKNHADEITIELKNNMAIAAAWAIEFMHSQDIIHRDIAARNCLYDKKNFLKLSDFGLSRRGSVYKMKQSRRMPTKWLSPESLQSCIFYQASDVYTYGVLLYEIYTLNEPFSELTSVEARRNILVGTFPTFDNEAPEEITKMIHSMIFILEHEKRATMSSIARYLEDWLGVELIVEKINPRHPNKEQQMDHESDNDQFGDPGERETKFVVKSINKKPEIKKNDDFLMTLNVQNEGIDNAKNLNIDEKNVEDEEKMKQPKALPPAVSPSLDSPNIKKINENADEKVKNQANKEVAKPNLKPKISAVGLKKSPSKPSTNGINGNSSKSKKSIKVGKKQSQDNLKKKGTPSVEKLNEAKWSNSQKNKKRVEFGGSFKSLRTKLLRANAKETKKKLRETEELQPNQPAQPKNKGQFGDEDESDL